MRFYAALWACLCIGLPPLLAGALRRRRVAEWRYFVYGVLLYLLGTGLVRLLPLEPFVRVVMALTLRWRLSPDGERLAAGAVLALPVAVLREGCRYLAIVATMRQELRTRARAVIYGLGYGWMRMLSTIHPARLGPWLSGRGHASGWTVLGVWGVLWDLPFDLALFALVLQAVRRRQGRWLVLAIFAHILHELALLLISRPPFESTWPLRFGLRVALHVILGLGSLWLLAALRDRTSGEGLPPGQPALSVIP